MDTTPNEGQARSTRHAEYLGEVGLLYQRRWLVATLLPWAASGIAAWIVPIALGGGGAFLWSILLHSLSLVSLPFLGWTAGRRAFKTVKPAEGDACWLVHDAAPTWVVAPTIGYTLGLTLLLWLSSALSYIGFLAVPPYLILWIAYNRWWWMRCREDATAVAIVEKVGSSADTSGLRLLDAGGSHPIALRRVDVAGHEIVLERELYARERAQEVWKVVGSTEALLRHLRRGEHAS